MACVYSLDVTDRDSRVGGGWGRSWMGGVMGGVMCPLRVESVYCGTCDEYVCGDDARARDARRMRARRGDGTRAREARRVERGRE